jgi:AraC-like DNA-binding protein
MKPILERIPQHQSESFYCEVVSARTVPTPWHFHPECQLTLVVNSVGNRFVGDNVSDFAPGDLVFVGPNLPHFWNHSGPQRPGADPVFSVVVQFREGLFGAEFMALPELARIRRLVQSGAVALHIRGATRDYAAERMLEIPHTKGFRRLLLLLEILERLSRSREVRPISSPAFRPDLNPLDEERVGKVCAFINQHLHLPIFREELARLVHLSPDAFGRFFRSRMGKSLPTFVNELRISRACRLLSETDTSITRISEDCGFENLSNFNRQFLRHTSSTPSQYRKSLLSPEAPVHKPRARHS